MKNKKNNGLDVVFLLDRSGSMQGSEEDIIGGYNSYLKQQRDKDAVVTTVLFDNGYELLHFRKDINEVDDLTNSEYFVRGCTALYDAIGLTIDKLDKVKTNEKVLFVIMTDGLENASVKYDKCKITEMIKGHSEWEFIYLGADIDSYAEGGAIGIRKNRIANYKKTEMGIGNLFESVCCFSECMMADEEIDDNWKKKLEEE